MEVVGGQRQINSGNARQGLDVGQGSASWHRQALSYLFRQNTGNHRLSSCTLRSAFRWPFVCLSFNKSYRVLNTTHIKIIQHAHPVLLLAKMNSHVRS